MDVGSFYMKKKADAEGRAAVDSAGAGSSTKCESRSTVGDRRLGLLQPEGVWRIFPRQQLAFDYSKTCWQSVAVFSYECEKFGREGQRKFLVTTYYDFGQHYLAMKPPRHYYEVITEESACHLYFDIEFKFEHNPQVPDPIAILDTFIQYVCCQLSSEFQVFCDRSNILDLDSSTDKKFSRHLVFHVPKTVFRSNLYAGDFVHCICDKLRAFKYNLDSGLPMQAAYKQLITSSCILPIAFPSGNDLASLFVFDDKEKLTLICDEGVYTRNRNFRLYLSCKLGKEACLYVAQENKFRSAYGEDIQRQRRSQRFNTLIDSLVCNVRLETAVKILGSEGRTHLKPTSAQRKNVGIMLDKSTSASSEEGFNLSPYPSIDQFITSQLTKGGVQGAIRRWSYFPQGKCLVYDIQYNRWCERIGQAHKSNNIMIIADLVAGTYYQKCHDPECKRVNFRSNEYPIPALCNPVTSSIGLLQTNPAGHEYKSQVCQKEVCHKDTSSNFALEELVGGLTSDDVHELEQDEFGSWEDRDDNISKEVLHTKQPQRSGEAGHWLPECGNELEDDSLFDQALNMYEASAMTTSNHTQTHDQQN